MVARKTTIDPVQRSAATAPTDISRAPEPGQGKDVKNSRDALHELAEAFGRLIARRLGDRRRGYGLAASILGALIVALIVVLLFRRFMQ